MNWLLLSEIAYITIIALVALKVIYDTKTTTKTLAYLLVIFFLPVVGIILYFSFGINYRKNKMYSKKLIQNEELSKKIDSSLRFYSDQAFEKGNPVLNHHAALAHMLFQETGSPITYNNQIQLLTNGEEKFPEVLAAIEAAQKTIHLEYYIYEDDEMGRKIENLLIQKVKEGVEVRFIYDDFGSSSIRKKMVRRLRAAGVKVYPFLKIRLLFLANRLNYRNHRKIIIIDSTVAFTGGINVSDKYINNDQSGNYWRDTHLKITGTGVSYLQYIFLCDWIFCSQETMEITTDYFPTNDFSKQGYGQQMIQIAASGPDSQNPVILYTIKQAIYAAKKQICITSPYFIPGDGLLDAIKIAALSGLDVKLLVPDRSDSIFVNAAACSYYSELLESGVEIYRYQKGFIHAKTLFVDEELAIIGTANMDYRSFELNFEVNTVIYDKPFTMQLAEKFREDLRHAYQIDPEKWNRRGRLVELFEQLARLLSPLL
jgi:cardiolipin synthase